MPRFVILRHEGTPTYKPGVHWDFMLEAGGVLRTWELCDEPREETTGVALQLADHRLDYLDYEGPVSRDRGVVTRLYSGEYRMIQDTPTSLVVELSGQQWQAVARLTRESADSPEWRIEWKPRGAHASS